MKWDRDQKNLKQNKHTPVFPMQLLKWAGPEDQSERGALVSLLRVSKRTLAFLLSCFVVMFVCREENNPSQRQKSSFISMRQCKKKPNKNTLYTVLWQTFKLQSASSPIKATEMQKRKNSREK